MKLNIKITEKDLLDLEEYKKNYVYTDHITNHSKQRIFTLGVYTIVVSEIRRNLRVWIQNLFAPFINAILYLTVFGLILGSRIGNIDGVPYIQFLIPGFLVMPVITAGLGNGSFTTFQRVFFKHIEELQMSPLQSHSVIIGVVIASVFRSVFIAFLIWIAGVMFSGSVYIYNPALVLLLLVLVSATFSLVGMINGLYARNFEELSFVPTFVMTPLLYVSGIFFSTADLPWFFAKLSLLNPLNHVVNSFRYSFLGTSDVNIGVSIAVLTLCFGVLYYYTNKIIKAKLNL